MDLGVYSTTELHRHGLNSWQIRRAVRSGVLVALRQGWYASPNADQEAVTAVRAGGVLGCVSALRKHGLWVPPGSERIHTRLTRHGESRTGRACRGFGSPPPAPTAIDSTPIALLCAARCLTPEHWIAVCDSAMNTANLSIGQMVSQMGPEAGRVAKLLDRCDPASQSGTESITRVRLRAQGFAVLTQPQIAGVGRVDLRVGRLLIECDSIKHHTSLENYQNDRRRDRRALVDGWLTMRLTYDDVLFGWDDVLADIRAITRADRHRKRQRP